MATTELKDVSSLKKGDIIRHKMTYQSFVVTTNYGKRATAVSTVDVTNSGEWSVVTPDTNTPNIKHRGPFMADLIKPIPPFTTEGSKKMGDPISRNEEALHPPKFYAWREGDYAKIEWRSGVWLVDSVRDDCVYLIGWGGERETVHTPKSLTYTDGPVTQGDDKGLLENIQALGKSRIYLDDDLDTIVDPAEVDSVRGLQPFSEEWGFYYHLRGCSDEFVALFSNRLAAIEAYDNLRKAMG